MNRDVHFDDERALQRSLDLPVEQKLAQDSGVKLEDSDVHVHVETQSIGSSGQRELGG